ncbi:MAG: hypothetical protein HZB99_00485 [Candidatus Harrisonbacteria bacterium]|nr:hypothetical protein [Candidatus Harrisonbacteria bacterium]
MDFNEFFQSKIFKIVLIAIGALIVMILVFKAGEFTGYRKARFSYKWGENYHRNFAGPKGGFFGDFRRSFGDRDYINAHGTFGSIIRIDGSTLIIKGKGEVEKTVLVSDKTTIDSRRESLKASDLKVDDQVVIIGSPNDQGQIEAKFIRVFR